MGIKAKIKNGITNLKEHWDVPYKGETTSIKEFLSFCFGSMGIGSFMFICYETISFGAGYFCGSIMEIKLMDFTIISFIALIVKYATLYIESISMTIFENLGKLSREKTKKAIIAYVLCALVGVAFYFVPSEPFETIIKGLPGIIANSLVIMGVGGLVNWFMRNKLCTKYGRYKPFMMLYGVPTALLSILIAFIPTRLDYTTKIVLLHFLFTLRSRFSVLYFDNLMSIVALITPNMVERQKYYSIGGIFSGFFRSIFRIIFPVLITVTGGYLAVESYRVFIPVLSIAGLLMGFAFVHVKERVAANREVTPKIDFKSSAKKLLANKYFWIINIANVFALWNGLADGVINYIFIYQMRMEWIVGFLSIIGVTSFIGNVLTPVIIKKFEKRTCIVFMRAVWVVVTCGYILALKIQSIPLMFFLFFIRAAISAACNGISSNMTADVLDYHQWKTGERADNMQTIFSWFTTPIATALGLVSPWLLSKVGYTSDWDVMFDTTIFGNIMNVYVILTIVGLIVSTIPFFFYNYTKADHDRYVEEIIEREKLQSAESKEVVSQ